MNILAAVVEKPVNSRGFLKGAAAAGTDIDILLLLLLLLRRKQNITNGFKCGKCTLRCHFMDYHGSHMVTMGSDISCEP